MFHPLFLPRKVVDILNSPSCFIWDVTVNACFGFSISSRLKNSGILPAFAAKTQSWMSVSVTHCSVVSGDIHVWKLLRCFPWSWRRLLVTIRPWLLSHLYIRARKMLLHFVLLVKKLWDTQEIFRSCHKLQTPNCFQGKSCLPRWGDPILHPIWNSVKTTLHGHGKKGVFKETLIHDNYISSHRFWS